mmetsp:Transcript_29299/g.62250  ORF Transcript_29299/g.62250 Transcript_29299/m.62250 type:complete len:104 (+) Transcript_29299:342-653(+)
MTTMMKNPSPRRFVPNDFVLSPSPKAQSNVRLTSYVEDFEFTCHGIRGRYSGEINEVGKPHGNGSFVREKGGMTYIGEWRDGERIGIGGYYTNGRLLGNVVWE